MEDRLLFNGIDVQRARIAVGHRAQLAVEVDADVGRHDRVGLVVVVAVRDRLGGDVLVGHDQLDARRARVVGLAGDREQARER